MDKSTFIGLYLLAAIPLAVYGHDLVVLVVRGMIALHGVVYG